MNVGFLNMQTDESGDAHGNNFTVARVSREYRNRSRGGRSRRQPPWHGRPGAGRRLQPHVRGRRADRCRRVHGTHGLGRPGPRPRSSPAETTVSDSAAPTALRSGGGAPATRRSARISIRKSVSSAARTTGRSTATSAGGFRPSGEGRVKEFGPRVYYDSFWDFDGFHQTQRYSIGGEVEFRNGAQISFSGGGRYEGLVEPFLIREDVQIEAGEYDDMGVFMFMNTNRGRAVSLFARVQAGGFFGGDQLAVDPSVSIRLGDYLTSQISWSYNDIDLPAGAFKVNLGRLRVTYAFSTRLLLQALVQYNDATDNVSTNLRFSWLERGEQGPVPGLQRDLRVRSSGPTGTRPERHREVQPRLRCVPVSPPADAERTPGPSPGTRASCPHPPRSGGPANHEGAPARQSPPARAGAWSWPGGAWRRRPIPRRRWPGSTCFGPAGSAIDGAVAAAAMLAVVEPMMTGLGGDAFLLYYRADPDGGPGELVGLNGSGRSPLGLAREALAADRIEPDSWPAVTVPGAVDLWQIAHRAVRPAPVRRSARPRDRDRQSGVFR